MAAETFELCLNQGVIGPILDGYLLREEERDAFEAGRMNVVPMIIGNNADEGAVFTRAYPAMTVDAYREYLSSASIDGRFGTESSDYYSVTSDADVPRAISNSFGDSQFYFGARGIARAIVPKEPKVYRYLFNRRSDGGAGHEAWHVAEVPYVMGNMTDPQYNDDDKILSTTMMDAWVRFVSTGDPNGGAVTNWRPYDLTAEPHLVLDAPLGVGSGLRNRQLDFIGRVQRATKK